MNYQRIYDSLISNAQSRKETSGYTEIHHIHPRSLGGTDDESNLVVLTAKEHYLAHRLLYKMYQNTEHAQAMSAAWFCMVNMNKTGQRYTSTQFAKAKEIWDMYNRGDTHATSDKTVYTFVHRNRTHFVGKRWEFRDAYDFDKGSIYQIVQGVTQLNWALIENVDETFYWPMYELTNGKETIRGNQETLLANYNIPVRSLKDMANKKSRKCKGYWIISVNGVPFEAKKEREYGTGTLNPAYKSETYTFVHPTHGEVVCTMKELCDRFGLVRTQVSAVVYGRQQTTKGWKVV